MPQAQERQLNLSLRLAGGSGEQVKLVTLQAYEALSQPFSVTIEALALAEIDLLPNLGLATTVDCRLEEDCVRYFNGILIDASFVDEVKGAGFLYRLTLAPKAHFHQRGRNFRIYQNKTVIDIVTEVLENCGIDYEVKATGGKRDLAYCVQYGESDFDFVCRLLEQEGIYYFYNHTKQSHILTLCDKPSQHEDLEPAELSFNPSSDSLITPDSLSRTSADTTLVMSWHEHASSGGEAKVTLQDYDFMASGTSLETVTTEVRAHEVDEIEIYAWPGRYYKKSDGSNLSDVLLESRRAQRLCYEAESQYPGIAPGLTFALTDHVNSRFNRGYMIIAVSTYMAPETYRSDMASSPTRIALTAIPDNVQFRAPQTTPRPRADGPETAVVTGPANEEIHVDKYGRIKVKFHWDRDNQADDTSSCWIRVSQTGGLGNIIIPRVGEEVLVDFINGDPDRPIIVGRVFNSSHMPQYDLPEHKTRALWRTKTYKRDKGVDHAGAETLDTGKPGANELRFEDATGEEEIFLHAEKDLKSRIRNDETHHVGKDVEIEVGVDRKEKVGNNHDEDIGNDRSTKIGNDETLDVGNNIKIDAGNEITITANSKITLKVGQSTITIGPTTIDIKTVALKLEGSANAALSSAMTKVEGSGVITMTGGVIKIN